MKRISKKRGAVALISILIISAITLILVISMSEINISTSKQYLNSSSRCVGNDKVSLGVVLKNMNASV